MTCSCSGLTEIREALPRKSINIQTRFWGSISSAVAMNSANGPFKSLTASPLVHCLGGNSLLAASQRSIESDTNHHGTDLGRLLKLTNLDTPIVLFIFCQGPVWGSNSTNIYPGKSGRRSLANGSHRDGWLLAEAERYQSLGDANCVLKAYGRLA